MGTLNVILQGQEQKQTHWGQYLAILTEQAWSITYGFICISNRSSAEAVDIVWQNKEFVTLSMTVTMVQMKI